MIRWRTSLLLLSLSGLGPLSAAAIDYSVLDNPQAIEIPDRNAKARWEALFQVDPDWITRQIAYLTTRMGPQMPTLIAARLLYHGDPWTRRSGDQTNPKRWKATDLDDKLALLREIRALRDPALGDVLKHALSIETDADLVSSALATLWVLDPKGAPDFAVRLADPRPANHLPGAAQAGVRQDALRFLLGVRGPEAAETRRALDWALLKATGGERNHALALLKRGDATDQLKAAIVRLDEERTRGELDDDGEAALALACVRLGSDIDTDLAKVLVDLAVNGDREVAAPAATALASNVSWTATVPIVEISNKVASAKDPVVRHVLMNLLVRVNTNAGAIDVPGSPWNALAAHRARLSSWEWEQYVK